MRHLIRSISAAAVTAALLSFALLTACGPGGNGAQSDISSSLIWTEMDQWPDNKFTKLVPLPEAGTVYAAAQGTSQDYDFFAVSLREISREGAEAYVHALERKGFLPISGYEEVPEAGAAAIGFVLEKDRTGVSLSCSGGNMVLYISQRQKTA